MDFDLTDEQQLVRETARAFTDNEIVARARENARAKRFDRELVDMLAAQGYLGAITSRTRSSSRRSAAATARCGPSSASRRRLSAARSCAGAPTSRRRATC